MGEPVEGEPNFGVSNANLYPLRTAITVANNTRQGHHRLLQLLHPEGRGAVHPPYGAAARDPRLSPTLTDSVVIDGYSQFASEPNTKPVINDAQLLIELDGVNAGAAATGLRIEADDVAVRGFIIQRFGDTPAPR